VYSVVFIGDENAHGIMPRGKWRAVGFPTLTE